MVLQLGFNYKYREVYRLDSGVFGGRRTKLGAMFRETTDGVYLTTKLGEDTEADYLYNHHNTENYNPFLMFTFSSKSSRYEVLKPLVE